MGARGRTSYAALTVRRNTEIEEICRPDAPYDLTDEQAVEWRAVVERLPAHWFPRETWGMLTAYCRHVVAARRVAQLIAGLEGAKHVDVEEYDKLLKMQERESRAISSLATRMRISQQATVRHESARKPRPEPRPWLDNDG